jgi:secretion/DNA translocation related CpaE-like protein
MPEGRRIVAVSTRADLRTAVARLAALTGAEVEVMTASLGLRAGWQTADLVVLGSDVCAAVATAGLPRRAGVVVVTTGEPDDALWQCTVELGALCLLRLPDDERRLVDLMANAVEAPPPAGSTIAVVGGAGGAGASTLAAALAVTSSRTCRTVLIDADPYGGGVDVLLGAEQAAGARWPDLAGARGRLSATALTDALLDVEGLAVLSWNRGGAPELAAEAAIAVMDAAARGFACTVVDLARYPDGGTNVFASAADLVVMVVPATVRATAAAASVAARLSSQCGQLQLVVRDAGAGRLAAGEVANALGLPVIATLSSEATVAAAAERGEPPLHRRRGSLADTCRDVLAAAAAEPAAA